MKKIRLITGLSILITIILFLGFSFFWMSFNPNTWSEVTRGMFIFLDFVCIGLIALGILAD